MSGATWPRAVFERLHMQRADPWGVGTRAYERDKYNQTMAVLAGRHFRFVLELGCSIGVMTARLARQADHVLAVDVAQAALLRARHRCAGLPGVSFHRGQLPGGFPALLPETCDLIVISELLYFLSPVDIGRLARHCLRVRQPGGLIVLVNWTGPTDTPSTGNTAARHFMTRCIAAGLRVTQTCRHLRYRVDVLTDAAAP
ncbi:class I SAM-dependent methyltransferase [Komagataeibacter sp. FNDCF1]|uniref:class I SAM-dependent methyltransferase n=1 Tax=Komagataeibacter sp. FNDCF1 TaxID=2878681 RepID=UPI001E4E432B|nr:class I SAM-dependent methyltransferase [Komagataeibacter sp. FNDCF1]MCE2563563.1 class I SAM-dependent methyltransferase [Komagataeibacter sp. FNDCF1]